MGKIAKVQKVTHKYFCVFTLWFMAYFTYVLKPFIPPTQASTPFPVDKAQTVEQQILENINKA